MDNNVMVWLIVTLAIIAACCAAGLVTISLFQSTDEWSHMPFSITRTTPEGKVYVQQSTADCSHLPCKAYRGVWLERGDKIIINGGAK